MIIQENISLKRFNTFKVDVSARYFVRIENDNELSDLLQSSDFRLSQRLILGGGSNILFTKNYNGLVIHFAKKGINVLEENDNDVLVEAFAGEVWDDLVTFCVNKEFYGVENLSLIPGTVGAAPIQNIGAYGVELKDVFESLEGIMLENGEKKCYTKNDCKFEYRDSIFKKELKDKFLITKIILRLKKHKHFNLGYRAFQSYLKTDDHSKLTLKDVSELVKRIRRDKLPSLKKFGNAGSFFKNPEINENKFTELQNKYADLVHFKISDDKYKIPAGWLIEKCGFKGKNIGNVGTFKKQALVIINLGNADGNEIKMFAENIQRAVLDKFGITLIPEVNII